MDQTSFVDLNVSPEKGTEMMQCLGVTNQDLSEPMRFSQVKEIMNFLNGFDNWRYMVSKVLAKSPAQDKVDHMFLYVRTYKDYLETNKKMEGIKKELSLYEY